MQQDDPPPSAKSDPTPLAVAEPLLEDLLNAGPDPPDSLGETAVRKLRILQNLARGDHEEQVADRLGITRQAVNHHARRFRESDPPALNRINKRPNLYEAGDGFGVAVADIGGTQVGWSDLDGSAPAGRVHGMSIVATVDGKISVESPRSPPPPKLVKVWETEGNVLHALYQVEAGQRESTVMHVRGPNRESVTVYPKAVFAAGTEGLRRALGCIRGRVSRVLAVLEGSYGFRFGKVRVGKGPEVAFPAPHLRALSGWGRDGVGHVDTSKGPGEIEAVRWKEAVLEMRRREDLARGRGGDGFGLLDDLFGDHEDGA